MTERLPSRLLKIATYIDANDTYEPHPLVLNHDGSPMKVYHAPFIRVLAKGLGVTFNIVMPEDGDKRGYLSPDGKSTGLNGMLERGETDLSVDGFSIREENLKAYFYTYPLFVTDNTFMTNKLEPQSKNFAVFEVFSPELWLSIGLCIILISLFLYILLRRREKYATILLETFGNLIGQPYSFQSRKTSTAFLLLHWFIGISVLILSYKAVILSVMTVPMMVGIRDISDLTKAAKQNSFACFAWTKGNATIEYWSKRNAPKVIGECLKRSISEGLYGDDAFRKYPYKKAFLAERLEMNAYDGHYYISDDRFFTSLIGIPYSKNFCCPRKLERVVHRIVAAGLYEKSLTDKRYIKQLRLMNVISNVDDDTNVKPLKLQDFTGAFILLFVGHTCSLLVFIAEIVFKKLHY